MKKKKITYAAQAKLILKKYEKRLGKNFTNEDKLAREALNRELGELKNKQENYKAQEQQTQFKTMMKNGGNLPKYQDPNNSNNWNMNLAMDINQVDPNLMLDETLNKVPIDLVNNLDYQRAVYGNPTNVTFTPTTKTDKSLSDKKDTQSDKYYNPALGGTSVLPLAANIAGNVLMSRGAETEDVKYERISPEKISLAREREDARRDAELARLTSLRTARGLGLSAGATANIGAAGLADINRVTGSRVSKSYLQEELSNKQSKERTAQINAQIGMREVDANLREKNYVQATKDQAIQNIIQGSGQYFSDVQKAKNMNQMMAQMPGTFKQFEDPDQTLMNRILMGQQSVGYHDPELIKRYNNGI